MNFISTKLKMIDFSHKILCRQKKICGWQEGGSEASKPVEIDPPPLLLVTSPMQCQFLFPLASNVPGGQT